MSDLQPDSSDAHDNSKYVKLRFTHHQFEAFNDACYVIGVVAEHPEFYKFLQKVLQSNLNKQSLTTQVVKPIVTAPKKVVKPKKSNRKFDLVSAVQGDGPKVTHFTKPISITRACRCLYDQLDPDSQAKYNIEQGDTSITDIRTMTSKYITTNNLKTEKGIIFDDFMQSIAPTTFRENTGDLVQSDDKWIIPKGNRKIIYRIAAELASSQ